MKKFILVLFSGLVILFAGCSFSFEPNLSGVETVLYENSAGYSIEIPEEWTIDSESEEITSFSSTNKAIVLNISNEMGGIEYVSLAEICDLISLDLQGELFALEDNPVNEESTTNNSRYRRTITGTSMDGNVLVADVFIFHPYPSIRYYLVVVANQDSYEKNQKLIEGIVHSFLVTAAQEDLYQIMMDRQQSQLDENEPAEYEEEVPPDVDEITSEDEESAL